MGGGGEQRRRQCRQGGGMVEVELDAARALADLAGIVPGMSNEQTTAREMGEEEEKASTRLSLELGKVGISSSSSSSVQQQQVQVSSSSCGPRAKQFLTEAEKEAKRLRRVLANRESARQTILRRQAIRDELARKVADLSSENENMKMEKEMAMKEYLSLKETNKQLKEQVAKTAKKSMAETRTAEAAAAQAEAMASTSPSQAKFPVPALYTTAPPVMPLPYVWGSWPPGGPGYEHASPSAAAGPGPPLCLAPCAWYYPLAHELRVSSCTDVYAQPFREQCPGHGSSRQREDSEAKTSMLALDEAAEAEDDPCSLTLAIDIEKKPTTSESSSRAAAQPSSQHDQHSGGAEEKAVTATEARKRRKELTRLKQMQHGNARQGGAQW